MATTTLSATGTGMAGKLQQARALLAMTCGGGRESFNDMTEDARDTVLSAISDLVGDALELAMGTTAPRSV